MFYNDFWEYSFISYFYRINLHRQKTAFSYLMFQGPKRRPNDLKLREHHFLEGTKRRSEGSAKVEGRGAKEGGPRGQIPWPRGAPYLPPRASDAVDLRPRGWLFT